MDENPYKSPVQSEPVKFPGAQPLLPALWQTASLLLMIFGVLGFCLANEYYIVALRQVSSQWKVYCAYLFFLIPAGMFLAGIFLRRPSAKP